MEDVLAHLPFFMVYYICIFKSIRSAPSHSVSEINPQKKMEKVLTILYKYNTILTESEHKFANEKENEKLW